MIILFWKRDIFTGDILNILVYGSDEDDNNIFFLTNGNIFIKLIYVNISYRQLLI